MVMTSAQDAHARMLMAAHMRRLSDNGGLTSSALLPAICVNRVSNDHVRPFLAWGCYRT